jgi:enoyl-CoA hydratase/carnithine racemase
MTVPEVLFAEIPGAKGDIGLITLSRPKALNALTQDMCILISKHLNIWRSAANIKAVVIRGEGEKAFCAGGDIRSVYENRQEPVTKLREFFWHEYRLNYEIFHFPKPCIAFLDGITMGGGVGISIHGSHRVATEKLVFAMPETTIGFFPDVGGSHFLPRCPGRMGAYLALTGVSIGAADASYLGISNSYVQSHYLTALLSDLVQTPFSNMESRAIVDKVLEKHASSPGKSPLSEHRQLIEDCFSHNEVEKVLDALENSKQEWAMEQAKLIRSKSPTSLKVTWEEIFRGAKLSFSECMRMEYRMVNQFLQGHDFFEGIRALLVDKDRNPKWEPANLADVTAEEVARYFTPLGEDDLVFHYEV